MFDTHYDLLTIAYVAYLKNDYSYLEKISKYFHDQNVHGVIANLYFMSKEEMSIELHPKYYQENVSVLKMFQISKKILESYLPDIDILFSIEGADFISGCDELEQLYHAGLDSLILTWNTESKYGSGNRSEKGLTDDGVKLLEKAISLGLGIDFSHANPKTFSNMLEVVRLEQEKGKDICAYASHSNSRALCDRDRNLTDQQLKDLATIGGLVGVFSNRNFIVPSHLIDTCTEEEKEGYYLDHIDHIASIIGKDNIMVATDNMEFCVDADPEYGEVDIYDYSTVGSSIFKGLSKRYDIDTVHQMMYQNAKEKIFDKIRTKNKGRGVK